jgi:GNAT superfamily N-acetyltransferase
MVEIIAADRIDHASQIREIFLEYLQWVNTSVYEKYALTFDIQAMVAEDMLTLDKFMPPRGGLLLGTQGEQAAGIACLKELYGDTGEIKRLYVRPEFRRQGLGQALITRILEQAVQIGYRTVRLDSARYMEDAHRLYRCAGFSEISAYTGSEIPLDYQKHWIFMEKSLQVGD